MSGRRPDFHVEGRDWPHRAASRFVVRGGIRWHVQMMGSGPTLLLLHGTGASTHSFRELMPLLARRFRVVAPDLPGHAFSTPPARFEPTLQASAAALDELLSALQLRPQVAVGHSAGAALLAQMVLDGSLAPQLLVALAGALVPFRGVGTALFAPAARLLAQSSLAPRLLALRARDKNSVERVVRSTGSSLDARGVELYRRLACCPGHVSAVLKMLAVWDLGPLLSALPRLPVPLLLLAGQDDLAVPVQQLRDVAARVPGARLQVVSGTGHLLHEEQPEAVARLLLEEVDAGARVAAAGAPLR